MEALFILKKLVAALVLPPTSLLLLAWIGVLLMYRNRLRTGRGLVSASLLLLTLLAWPPVSAVLTRSVAFNQTIDWHEARTAQAIVVLGGGIRRNGLEYGGDTVGVLSLERARYAAYLARKTGLPVLVTGGVVFSGTPEAEAIRDVLEREFGVPVQWVEQRSRNTHQNAVNSASMLVPVGVRRILLVAHTFDMRRARREFTQAGLDAVPAATGVAPPWTVDNPLELLPSMGALQGSYYAIYELAANLAAWFTSKARD
jgi:uncharacterized SAM-binding protein YcdF (DUF218 family)